MKCENSDYAKSFKVILLGFKEGVQFAMYTYTKMASTL